LKELASVTGATCKRALRLLSRATLQTVTLHSPLFITLSHQKVSSQAAAGLKNDRTKQTVERKKVQLRRRKKEIKRARRVFDEVGNIYKPKPYRPKMATLNGSPGGGAAFQEDLSNVLVCPDCKVDPPNLTEETAAGDMVCQDCGVVVASHTIDSRSEWRTFANDDQAGDDPSRVGGPQDEFQDGEQLSTSVAFSESRAHKNLARTQNNANEKGSKGLTDAYRQIVAFCEVFNGGSNVSNAAKHIYKLVDKHKVMRNKKQEAIIATCVFIAFRQNNAPRTFKEIGNLTTVSKKDIGKVYKQLQDFLVKLKEEDGPNGTSLNHVSRYEKTSVNAAELCGRYVSQLGFKNQQKIMKWARGLAERSAEVDNVSSRSPLSTAAACIYMACHLAGEPKSAAQISDHVGVSDGTVKTVYKHLAAEKDKIIKQEFIDEGANVADLPST